MKGLRKYIFIVAVLVMFISISMVCVFNVQAAARHKTNREMKILADPIMDNILDGFKLDDYVAYSKDFDQALKVIGSRTKFFKVSRFLKQSIGNYMYREYMGSLHKDNVVVVLWKGTFDKSQEDVLIKLFLAKKHNRYVVTGLKFQ